MTETLSLNKKQIVAAILFLAAGVYIAGVVPTVEIAWVSAFLLFTIFLFAFEVVEVDVAAVTVMVLLGLSALFAPLMGLEQGLVDPNNLFNGFASNAVISIIAVMIIGAGLDRTGIMTQVAGFILRVGGSTEARVIPLISGTVGVISSFMQNVGAAALFLPVVSRISARTGLPMSRLLMPMGFCAILGGTMTMVGSSPVILLNDLLLTSNKTLPPDQQMDTFGLFAITPIGIALVSTGVIYFILAGRFVLPTQTTAGEEGRSRGEDTKQYFQEVYGVGYDVIEVEVPDSSPLVGADLDRVEHDFKVRVIAVDKGDGIRVGTAGVDRSLGIEAGARLALLGTRDALDGFVGAQQLRLHPDLDRFSEVLIPTKAGIAEIVIPPGSRLIGKTARDLWLRKTYGLSLLAIHRGGKTVSREGEGVRDIPLESGDTLVVHTTWVDLARLERNRDFVIVTTEYPHEEERPHKVPHALVFFAITLALVLFTDLRLSVALLTGAVGMVLSGVLSIEEAYRAVSWKTVFLLASLIPLGLAVETTGTARYIAEEVVARVGDAAPWVIQAAIAVLATFFTLVMSNVGATVLLVPLAINIAVQVGADPAIYALTVAIATSNSFLIPTHQVNALIMGPGGYRVPDFMRAGGIMTILFLIVSLTMLNVVF
ncbi:SLC13 family permease [Thiohalobacter thiocyanaticus]|uniref:SLC13 family permease n=1 Tax=Thiohalobacter thiocyanaticus TaxID=585455 RepID=UPI0015B156F7|nr:SLC13 family permease [Thiohalobacter thiocyanaticus]